MSRITVKRRHTGRWYIGMDPEVLISLRTFIRLGKQTSQHLFTPAERDNLTRLWNAIEHAGPISH
jgi:hypothetical protein